MLAIMVKNERRSYLPFKLEDPGISEAAFRMFFQQVFGILVSNCPAFYEDKQERPGGAFQTWRGLKGGQENKWKLRD